jgi:ATP-dependent helicase HepA
MKSYTVDGSGVMDKAQVHSAMMGFLSKTAELVATYLEKLMPTLFDDWWTKAVVSSLSFQQRRRVEQQGISGLSDLDLAALLRVLDQNWYQISLKTNPAAEAKHFLKEMQTVRNRWAHAGTEGFPVDDVYRDFDTLQRFALTIEANQDFIHEIQNAKSLLLSSNLERKETQQAVGLGDDRPTADLVPGQIVHLKSNPAIRGAIVGVLAGKPETRYQVFADGGIQTFYASQIQAEGVIRRDFIPLPCEEFHAHLSALQLRHPGLSTLYSLNAARIDFIPYQFRPVLKFIRSDRPRLLIADAVGVGKTIEAGLILRELQARRDVHSVLIICPRPLVTEKKWVSEMKRFEERFTHLDGRRFRYCINEMDLEGVWPDQYQKVIIPYSLFDEEALYGSGLSGRSKRKKGLLDLDPPPRFDLVIVDEAHHIRNTETFNHRAVRFFCDHAEAVLFLTATPIQLGSHDLFVLLNTLRPDLIIDKESFDHMAEPNPFINQAISAARANQPGWAENATEALRRSATTAWGRAILERNPEFTRVRQGLSEGSIGDEERVEIITRLESLHTFSGIISRTRRRDIGDFTVRKPQTKVVDFTPEQQLLHDEVLAIQAEILKLLHEDVNVRFMMMTIRRQAASCLYGLAPLLNDILNRHIDELLWDEADNDQPAPGVEAVEAIRNRIQTILEHTKHLDPRDPKLEVLKGVLEEKLKLPNKKVMIFSSFRHTLNYLFGHLQSNGFRVGLVHGGTPDAERLLLRSRFKQNTDAPDTIDVLLFSEIGCEGLDYQFCDCIVNYDLPWNPMRVEQRIGRIDRNGQKSETVAIFNFITPGTVDADIYDCCLFRIGVFDHALGGGEEVLGEITQEIRNIAENFTLTDEERKRKLEQLADNKIRLIQEQENLEQRQLELFGIRLPADQLKKEIEEASSFWLSPAALRNLVSVYLKKTCGGEKEFILGDKALKTLRMSQEGRTRLLKDFQDLPRQNVGFYRDWELWLKETNPHLTITFDPACASLNPEASFIMPLHPLVKQAAKAFDAKERILTHFRANDQEIQEGHYPFVVYQWRFHGMREDLVLYPITVSSEVSKRLEEILQKAEDDKAGSSAIPDELIWDELDANHHREWSSARERHVQRTKQVAEYQRESLTASHRARIAMLSDQLSQASDEKIRRMRQSQISAAEADYARRVQQIDIAMERSEITAEPVAFGIMRVEKGPVDAQ